MSQIVTCNRCSHTWIYTGDSFHITCPSCLTRMKNPEKTIPKSNRAMKQENESRKITEFFRKQKEEREELNKRETRKEL